ncbi:MAG: glycerol-3-phosphate dehydrogenase/oxidase [Planctomycetota bacterium]|nr:MAG: glycerol-3-phosphate dehydrogenase/oxidase [Planctomycetota bacterium]
MPRTMPSPTNPPAWRLPPRSTRVAALAERTFDVAVIGGGITGCGLALDLTLRGLSVALVERGDWGGATSSASSRLIHGGLRYLETGDLALVRESCRERALLLSNAAGLVWPERFVFPVHAGARVGRAKLSAGLWLYTALSLPRALGTPGWLSRADALRAVPALRGDGLRGAGTYMDGATHDARLALAVLLSAARANAVCVSRCEATAIEGASSGVAIAARDLSGNAPLELRAAACVLAGGPFTSALRACAGLGGDWIAPTRGTHVVVPRERLPTDGAVIFTSAVDGRVMFLIPWPRHTVIGTTDVDADPSAPVAPTEAERDYLLESANALAPAAALRRADVVSAWAGLRPLLRPPEAAAPSQRSREERVEREGNVYTIAGGKLTGYRSMAEKLGARIARELGRGDASAHSPTRTHALVGALARPVARPAWSRLDAAGAPLAQGIESALVERYGALAADVRAHCERTSGGTVPLSADVLAGERSWAEQFEDATCAEDFTRRRTSLAYTDPSVALD